MNKILSILSILIIAVSCIDPIDIDTPDDVNLLTVEGFITTQPGPHNIRLSLTAQYGSVFQAFPQRINEANVAVRDSDGIVTLLNEVGNGNYQTPAGFRAEVGKDYSLLIEALGNRYISFPEPAVKAPAVDEIVYRYEEVPSDNELLPTTGIKVFIQFQDNAETSDFYMLENVGSYTLSTRPDLFTVLVQGVPVPAPKDCCFDCFARETADNNVRLESDRLFNGSVTSSEVAYIRDNGRRFVNNRYQVTTKISSLSKDAFQYLSLIENQKSIDGDIFDPPPAQIRGNFINLDDPEEEIIGFFYVTDSEADSTFLDLSIIPNLRPPSVINDDCNETTGATSNFPDWW